MASNGVNGTHEADGNLQGSSPCSSSRVSPRPETLTGTLDNKVQAFKAQVKLIFRTLLIPPLVHDSEKCKITLKQCLKMFDENEESFKTVARPILIRYLADLITELILLNENRVKYTGTPATAEFKRVWFEKITNLQKAPQIQNLNFVREVLMEFSTAFKAYSEEDQHFLREFMIREIAIFANALTHRIDIEKNQLIGHFHALLEKQHAELQKLANNSNAAMAAMQQEKNVLISKMEELKQRNASFEKEIGQMNLKMKKMAEDLEEKTRKEQNGKSADEFLTFEAEEEIANLEEELAQLKTENQELKSQLENGGKIEKPTEGNTSIEHLENELRKLSLDREKQATEMNEMRQKIAVQQLTIDELKKEDNRDAVESLERKKSENSALRKQIEELTSRMEEHKIKILAVLDEDKEENDERIRSQIQAIFTKEDDSTAPITELDGSPAKLKGFTSSNSDESSATSEASDDSVSNRPKRKTGEKNYCDNKKNKK
ncbi:hypothetical protein CRE_06541 [Caenorhabditis remanei]|uniref:Uncharacterized protein n=1 Tax=Caenorhabditis remanei TaxID=31234 RepID=E3M1G5_CAERE|nr:hypothetical protein CRE_06541 [Caenorhabditis remanei]